MMAKQNITPFFLTLKKKQLLMKVILMMSLNQSIILLYQTYKNLFEKVKFGLLIQS